MTTTSLQLTEQAKTVLEKRYLKRDPQTHELQEDFEGLFWRVALAVAWAEKNDAGRDEWASVFHELMTSFRFEPNSPTLMNAGTGAGSLAACFVLELDDSMEGIMKCAHDMAIIQKHGGGTGVSLSKLRQRGAPISTTHGRACGPIKVLEMLSSVSSMVTQGGKRDGANMAVMSCHHPDILEFIHCKDATSADESSGKGAIHNFNISVGITDAFMQALRGESDEVVTMPHHYNLVEPHTQKTVGILDARDVWDAITRSAWKTGDPGVIFLNRINEPRTNPMLPLGWWIDATNPCGEAPLYENDQCNLGSINLSEHVKNGDAGLTFVDWDGLNKTVMEAVRFLDNVVTVNQSPLPEITEMNSNIRRIGLGVMGWADMLIKLRIPYDSEEAVGLGEIVMARIQSEADAVSALLGKERGSFPLFYNSVYADGTIDGFQTMRNSTRTTIAPTGCQVASTMVITDQGVLRLCEMGDVNGQTWQSLGLKVAQEQDHQLATRFYVNGRHSTLKITTACGAVLECTPNHRYRVFDDEGYVWRCASDLNPFDRLAIRMGGYNKTDEPFLALPPVRSKTGPTPLPVTYPKQMTPELAELLGIFAGNGSVHTAGLRIHFGTHLEEKIRHTEFLIERVFGVRPIRDVERRWGTCTSLDISCRLLRRWLESQGLIKRYSIEADIPQVVRRSSARSLQAFINGLELADGSHIQKTRYIDTASFRLAQDLLVCMRALGTNARVITNDNSNANRISRRPSYRVVMRLFNADDKPSDRYAPSSWQSLRSTTRKVAQEMMWDEVVSIECSENETFDIEVPSGNAYLSNNVVSHNTISIIAGCSSGIEPVYAFEFEHHGLEGRLEGQVFRHPLYQDALNTPCSRCGSLEREAFSTGTNTAELCACACHNNPDARLDCTGVRPVFKTAHDIAPEWHIKMQAAFQKHVDNAVSKTINLPHTATVDDVRAAYDMAWNLGCKGVTIYRDGSKSGQVLTATHKEADSSSLVPTPLGHDQPVASRPMVLDSKTIKQPSPFGNLYVTVSETEPGHPFEVFATIGKAGSDVQAMTEAACRAISQMLRLAGPMPHRERLSLIAEQFSGIGGSSSNGFGAARTRSIPDAIAKALRRYLDPGTERVVDQVVEQIALRAGYEHDPTAVCPDCKNATVYMAEGCALCQGCGWSRC